MIDGICTQIAELQCWMLITSDAYRVVYKHAHTESIHQKWLEFEYEYPMLVFQHESSRVYVNIAM